MNINSILIIQNISLKYNNFYYTIIDKFLTDNIKKIIKNSFNNEV
jgi:hypothetical protein